MAKERKRQRPKDMEAKSNGFEQIQFKMHPRVFAALGADLVTNDVVAVIELVKNSYDAFAENVWIRFGEDKEGVRFLEIEDDGTGMTREVIEDAWCVVATPFKADNPTVESKKRTRRVAGEKGLGRLSVSRLGQKLHLLTQSPGGDCWELEVDWSVLAGEHDLSACFTRFRKYEDKSPFSDSGTKIRILPLKSFWDAGQTVDLEDNLTRLISPFSKRDDFSISISLKALPDTKNEELEIKAPLFLSQPKYSIAGKVDARGNIKARYRFKPIQIGRGRTRKVELSWEQVFDGIKDKSRFRFSNTQAGCGKFNFEIRAWDIGAGRHARDRRRIRFPEEPSAEGHSRAQGNLCLSGRDSSASEIRRRTRLVGSRPSEN